MYKITISSLRYGSISQMAEYYAEDNSELEQLKTELFLKENIEQAVQVEYSLNNSTCQPTDNWDEIYYSFEEGDNPKWGYVIDILLLD